MTDDEQISVTRDQLQIHHVELLDESDKGWRTLNDADPINYPVSLQLSRSLDAYEVHAVNKMPMFTVNPDYTGEVVINCTTLESVRNSLDDLTAWLNTAAENGRLDREQARAENARLDSLLDEINAELESRTT